MSRLQRKSTVPLHYTGNGVPLDAEGSSTPAAQLALREKGHP